MIDDEQIVERIKGKIESDPVIKFRKFTKDGERSLPVESEQRFAVLRDVSSSSKLQAYPARCVEVLERFRHLSSLDLDVETSLQVIEGR